jgi:feruloyl-CoA synthase
MARREALVMADGKACFGDWQRVSYGEAWCCSRRIAQGLLNRGLSAERPVVILSENGLEHALLALGCMVAGVPFVPTSPAYSLISIDHDKLNHVLRTVTPGMLFASDASRYGKAILATASDDMEVVLVNGTLTGRDSTPFADLAATTETAAVEAAMAATGPDTIAKFLFTSGSTKRPKAVINTQRMLCANQQQAAQSMPVDDDAPLVLVDWLPWNHTFGGNNNFGMVLYHGGSLYIDDGKPTPALIGETLRNLREIAPTVYFNVPTGYEAIASAMKTDDALRKTLLSRVRMFFYAGAAMPQSIWDSLYESAEREIGQRVVIASGLGMTETAPHCLAGTHPHLKAGELGLPMPGLQVKLVDIGDKTEIRYKGPNVTPGYWRAPTETAEHFDEEGFFCSGDAVKWIDETDIHLGLKFDGRIAEDFKLATGTFVSVGPLRSQIITAGAPYIQDVVITGLSYKEVGAMVIPSVAIRTLSGLPSTASMQEVVDSEPVLTTFQVIVDHLAATATGSAHRIARLCLLADPPSLDRGEITDKGSINQRAVLTHRAGTVANLHADGLRHIIKPQNRSQDSPQEFVQQAMFPSTTTRRHS